MAGTHEKQRRVVSFFTAGKAADDRYGLSAQVGRLVKRGEDARITAVASTARKASPIIKDLLSARYSIKPSLITGRSRVKTAGITLAVEASTLKFPLSFFGGQWAGRHSAGATAAIQLGQRKTYAGTFVAAGRFAGQPADLIYGRIRGKKVLMKHGRYSGKTREPIVALKGPSTAQMITGRITQDGRGNDISIDNGATANTLQGLLISYFLGEYRRLYVVSGGNG